VARVSYDETQTRDKGGRHIRYMMEVKRLNDGGCLRSGKGFQKRNRKGGSPYKRYSPKQGGFAHEWHVKVHQSETQKEIRSVHKEG
jgi:hypothetical protein